MRDDMLAAQSLCQNLINADDNHADAWHLLGLIDQRTGNPDQARTMFDRAIAIDHHNPNYRLSAAILLKSLGQLEQAADAYQQLLELHHDHAAAWSNLANAYIDLKRYDQAIRAAHTAIRIDPNLAPAHHNLGRAYRLTHQLPDAIHAYHRATQLQPANPTAWLGLGIALRFNDQYDDAYNALEHAVALDPNLPDAWHELGKLQRDLGETDASLQSFTRVANLDPCDDLVRDIAVTLNYTPSADLHETFEHHQRWAQRIESHALKIPSNITPHNLAPPPHTPHAPHPPRALRIGYASPDFRQHACASFIEPLLTDYDRTRFEIFCYADVSNADIDAITKRLQSHVPNWRNTHGMTDDQFAQQIDDDRIDILIDLAGHTADNRLTAFARRLAPIQATYLGYPNTTALKNIDYRITDPYADPIDLPTLGTETLLRIDGGLSCYRPSTSAPEPNPLPALQNHFITFGSLANPAKINQPLLALWCQTLNAIPDSRLLLIRQTLCNRVKKRITDALQQFGLTPDRFTIQSQHDTPTTPIASYHHFDIALDTFPYAGHTTTCESLWMGVPTITLVGDCYAARMGASVLTQAGFPDWIASTPEQFIAIAVQLAAPSRRDQLANLRQSMRHTIAASSLCNTAQRVPLIERAYIQMWQNYQCKNITR